jgi:hypothetical protein
MKVCRLDLREQFIQGGGSKAEAARQWVIHVIPLPPDFAGAVVFGK